MTVNYDAPAARSVQVVTGLTAAGRVAAGAAAFAKPERVPRIIGLDRGTSRRGAVLVRLFAAREVALGLGALHALSRGRDVRPWLVAQAIGDAGDALAFAAATRGRILPPLRGAAVTVAAVTGVVGGLMALRSLRR